MVSFTFHDYFHDLIEGDAVAAFTRSCAKRRRKSSDGAEIFLVFIGLYSCDKVRPQCVTDLALHRVHLVHQRLQ